MALERQTQPFTSSRASQGARQITGACPTQVATQRVEPRAPCRERSGCRTKGHWEPERPLERRTSHRRVFSQPYHAAVGFRMLLLSAASHDRGARSVTWTDSLRSPTMNEFGFEKDLKGSFYMLFGSIRQSNKGKQGALLVTK